MKCSARSCTCLLYLRRDIEVCSLFSVSLLLVTARNHRYSDFGLEEMATSAGRAIRTLTNTTSLSFTPTNALNLPFSGVPPVFYNRDIGYEDYVTSVKLLRKECAVFKSLTDGECIGSRRPRYTDITVT